MNICALIGNLGQDPEVEWKKYTDNTGEEQAFCTCPFSISTKRYSKKEKKDIANWIKCKASGKTAENIGEYFKKGHKIGITGELITDTWKNDAGENRSMTYVQVTKFDFLTKKDGQESQRYGEQENSSDEEIVKFGDSDFIGEDEIPF